MDLSTFLPSLGGGLATFVAFVVVLSIIVAIHEYGHYIVGKWSGIHADVFSLGFGKVLFSRVDKHGTKWQVAALPFGGYVKFAGDANAASAADPEALTGLSEREKRRTMQGAPLWARTATVAAGPLFNFALSIVIFAAMALATGVSKEPLTVGEILPLPQGSAELRSGDVLLGVEEIGLEGEETLIAALRDLPRDEPFLTYAIERDGTPMSILGPHLQPPRVQNVSPQSAALAAGIEEGDVILRLNDTPIATFEQMIPIVEASGGQEIAVDLWRDGEEISLTLTPKRTDIPDADGGFETRYLMGVSSGLAFTPATESVGLFEAAEIGVMSTYGVIKLSLSGMYHLVTGAISTCNIAGPLGIAQASGQAASGGFMDFVGFIALISAAIGLMNLFPIPVLDGGHLVFYAYEAVFRKPPSDGAMRILMSFGLVLILSLMTLGLTTDIFC
ncbi:RIP metalloprotease RseP [Halocynthiibacter sp. C4]|uniref:RIP metalloprotease RseP n=1 Tax=Halocynthiibacter sp. C4 TaxID=2992758 RepID=UPI00237C3649|nr:RIP metalloprotease RseP [Halocynthiibacter sp. C4]MDE0589648.1 RIP metalloprotease RseP [Halocynthiibacter sp. C4]